ncbi:MAG: hypothetical protein Q4B95_03365 [Lonepinella koalarum]|nr:hypothetical protein [Lonepinella koalarum]
MNILKPNFKTYPQTNRLFVLNKISIERCREQFPEHYHFKKQQAKECEEIADRLEMGLALLVELKAKGLQLNNEQDARFKAFRNGARYLIKQFKETALHVSDVENGQYVPTPYSPIISTNEKGE